MQDTVVSLTLITLHSYAKNFKYVKKKKIRSLIILTVCLLKVVRMKFLLYKRVSYTFCRKQNKAGNKSRIGNMHFTVEIPKLHSVETEGKNNANNMIVRGRQPRFNK